MLKNSIYSNFIKKFAITTTIISIITIFIINAFTKNIIYDSIQKELLQTADTYKELGLINNHNLKVKIVNSTIHEEYKFFESSLNNNHYMTLIYRLKKNNEFIEIVKNINIQKETINNLVLRAILLMGILLVIIIFYTNRLLKRILTPISTITKKLSRVNENSMRKFDTNQIPIEFQPLIYSFNSLITKLNTHIKYKKDLFIGAAHELKTPLANIKLKSEVTLLRKRDSIKYEETLRLQIEEVNRMDKMLTSILEIGRLESVKFDNSEIVDINLYVHKQVNFYFSLYNNQKLTLEYSKDDKILMTSIKLKLIDQIILVLLNNAIKFSSINQCIHISTKYKEKFKLFIIEIVDEGIGIDLSKNVDIFAPFTRINNNLGSGLGLYLAKNAAETLNAKVVVKNRPDGIQGTTSKVILKLNDIED